jgi:hypothetical protein
VRIFKTDVPCGDYTPVEQQLAAAIGLEIYSFQLQAGAFDVQSAMFELFVGNPKQLANLLGGAPDFAAFAAVVTGFCANYLRTQGLQAALDDPVNRMCSVEVDDTRPRVKVSMSCGRQRDQEFEQIEVTAFGDAERRYVPDLPRRPSLQYGFGPSFIPLANGAIVGKVEDPPKQPRTRGQRQIVLDDE